MKNNFKKMAESGRIPRGQNRCPDRRRNYRNVRGDRRGELDRGGFRFGSGGNTFPADLGGRTSRGGRITIPKMRRENLSPHLILNFKGGIL